MAGRQPQRRSSDGVDVLKRVVAVAKFCRANGADRDESLYAILDAAVEVTHASKGNIQLLDPSGALVIAAHRGFDDEFLAFFARVSDVSTACGVALTTGEQFIVEDVAVSEVFAGTEGLGVMARAGARAVVSTPLCSSAGKVVGMISTHFERPHRPTDGELAAASLLAGIAADHLEHGQTRKHARWSAEALETLLEILPIPASLATDPECRVIRSNSATAALYGVSRTDNLSQTAAERGEGVLAPHYVDGRLLRPDELPMQRAAATGAPQRNVILDFALPDGQIGTISAVAAPLFDDDGAVMGAVGAFADITALRRAHEVQESLTRELLHRGNNLLAVVQTLAHRSLADGVGVDEGLAKLELRLQALARANNMLANADFVGVSINQLVRAALEPFAPQSRVSGELVCLGPMDVQNLTMAIHELATNALKYGALSNDEGVVSVAWEVNGAAQPHVRFVWREEGGPPVVAPTRRGAGTRLIRSLYKDVDFDFAPDGLRCEISLPLKSAFASERRDAFPAFLVANGESG